MTGYQHLAVKHVVKARYQLNERGFSLARAAYNAYRLTGAYLKADIRKRKVLRIVIVAEINVPELYLAVFHLKIGIRAYNIYLLVKHLVDAPDGGLCYRNGNDHKAYHCKRADYLRGVSHKACQLAGVEGLEAALRYQPAHDALL